MSEPCQHSRTLTVPTVSLLAQLDEDGKPIDGALRWELLVRVLCADCQAPFRFVARMDLLEDRTAVLVQLEPPPNVVAERAPLRLVH